MIRKASAKGLDLVCVAEELRLTAYLDTGDVWTIGWGHTRGVKEGDTCSELQAISWRKEDMEAAEREVNLRCADLPLTQSMFDCLVSFEFNTGGLMLKDGPSKVLVALREHRWADAGEEMIRWNIDNGRTLQGLFRRRVKELSLYASEKWPV